MLSRVFYFLHCPSFSLYSFSVPPFRMVNLEVVPLICQNLASILSDFTLFISSRLNSFSYSIDLKHPMYFLLITFFTKSLCYTYFLHCLQFLDICCFFEYTLHYFICTLFYMHALIFFLFPPFSHVKGNHLRLKRKLYNSMDAIELMKVQARGMALMVKQIKTDFCVTWILSIITISLKQMS